MRITRALLALLIGCVLAPGAGAAENKADSKKKDQPAPAVAEAPKGPSPKSAARVAEEQLLASWQKKLAGPWSVTLRPPTPAAGKPQQDTLTFEGRRVVSALLAAEGYGGSNVTVTPQDQQTASWETMQTNPAGDVVVVSGELHGNALSGTFNRQPAKSEASTWSFNGAKAAPAPAPAAAQPAPPTK